MCVCVFYYFDVLILIFSSYSVRFSIVTLSFQQRFIVKPKHKINREIRKKILFLFFLYGFSIF